MQMDYSEWIAQQIDEDLNPEKYPSRQKKKGENKFAVIKGCSDVCRESFLNCLKGDKDMMRELNILLRNDKIEAIKKKI